MQPDVQVAIIGAGFAGLGAAIRLSLSGRRSFVVFERSTDVGGTWRENTYPGCACDVPSHLYSFSFAPNPGWSKAYSPQPEIQQYLRHCVDQFNLRDQIRFQTAIVDTRWDEATARWHLTDQHGNQTTARVVVAATGPFTRPSVPKLSGLGTFTGTVFHSARWNHEYDLRGKRVAVIGTGASAIQIVPALAPQVAQLTVFQRTPPYVMPRNNRTYPAWQQRLYRTLPLAQQLHRHLLYWLNEAGGLAFMGNALLNKLATGQARRHLEAQVSDPDLRRRLWPTYTFGCKRVLVSDDYYPALTRPNVTLVTDPIETVTPTGIRTTGTTDPTAEQPFDALIFSTGFQVADLPVVQLPNGRTAFSFTGRNGRDLLTEWAQTGPQALYGMTASGFPNLLFLLGPNTGLGHTSVVHMIESQLNYLLSYLHTLEQAGDDAFLDVKPDSQRTHNDALQQQMAGTVWASGCRSWYMDAQGRNTTLWPALTVTYRQRTRRVNLADYVIEQAAQTVSQVV